MRILLTNDDGIASPGIILLTQALRKAGHQVFVIAPDSDRSGVSHCISFLGAPCKLVETEPDTWSCSGTPADCVITGLLGGVPELRIIDNGPGPQGCPPDLVLSGINRGANIGTDIIYSGTAAAARQGSFLGVPSAALSLVEREDKAWHWEMAVSFVLEHLEEIRQCWKADTFVNVNIPNGPAPPPALVPAFPAVRSYNDRITPYEAPGGGRYCFALAGKVSAKPETGSDWDAVLRNHASMSAVFIHPVVVEAVQRRGEGT